MLQQLERKQVTAQSVCSESLFNQVWYFGQVTAQTSWQQHHTPLVTASMEQKSNMALTVVLKLN